MQLGTLRRKDLPKGEVLCQHCTGHCCRYFALPIETPTEWKDFEYIYWYMIHGRVVIFIDEGTWYLQVFADCRHLQADNRCGIYQHRPQICRDYSTKVCEYDNPFLYDKLFEVPEQILEYAEAVLPPRKAGKNRRLEAPSADLLPILF